LSARTAFTTFIVVITLTWSTSALGRPDRFSLDTLESFGDLTVALDTARFARERVATMRLTNNRRAAIEGNIPACRTIFVPADTAFSRLRPSESGPFFVGPDETVRITRPFRMIDAGKRPPGNNTAYKLDEDASAEAGCKD
jgi:hypothetical protein